jgi:sec-independent protein translocase protein TatC
MSLGAHLVELRKRLIIAAIAVVLGLAAGWFLEPFVWDGLRGPVLEIAKSRNATINYSDLTSAFDLKLQIAFYLGIVIASPVWLFQIWSFLVPGLTRREKGYAVGFVGSAIPLFLVGCWAGWTLLPHMVEILTSFASTQDSTFIDARQYFSFVIKLVLAVGIGFVMPVFLTLLNFVGVISGKRIIGSWRIALLIICLFTAITTPSADVISMFLLAVPLVVLYFAAAVVSLLHDRLVTRRRAAVEAEYEAAAAG